MTLNASKFLFVNFASETLWVMCNFRKVENAVQLCAEAPVNPDRRLTAICVHCGTEFKYRAIYVRGKFCSIKCMSDFTKKFYKERMLKEDCLFNAKAARRFLIERDGYACKICRLTEWMGQSIPLVCDHIDGNAENWSIANCRMICCNCDAQTPTYKGKNKGNGRASRMRRYHAGLSY